MIAYICVIICHLSQPASSQPTHRLSYRQAVRKQSASTPQSASKQSASSQQAVSKQSASSPQAVRKQSASKRNVCGTEELCRRLP